jgi:hypothetical protein
MQHRYDEADEKGERYKYLEKRDSGSAQLRVIREHGK